MDLAQIFLDANKELQIKMKAIMDVQEFKNERSYVCTYIFACTLFAYLPCPPFLPSESVISW